MGDSRAHPWRTLRAGSIAGTAALLGMLAFPTSADGATDEGSARALEPCSVSMAGFAFSPSDCTVNVGETVTWTHNQPGVSHTVTSDSDPAAWEDSGFLSAGQTFGPITFEAEGDLPYHCRVHPTTMQGVIHVVPVP